MTTVEALIHPTESGLCPLNPKWHHRRARGPQTRAVAVTPDAERPCPPSYGPSAQPIACRWGHDSSPRCVLLGQLGNELGAYLTLGASRPDARCLRGTRNVINCSYNSKKINETITSKSSGSAAWRLQTRIRQFIQKQTKMHFLEQEQLPWRRRCFPQELFAFRGLQPRFEIDHLHRHGRQSPLPRGCLRRILAASSWQQCCVLTVSLGRFLEEPELKFYWIDVWIQCDYEKDPNM